MKVLITGSTGLVGSRIVERLSPKYEFVSLLHESGFDITDEYSVRDAISRSDAPVLVHLAAFTDVSAAWKQRGDKDSPCHKINVLGTRNIAKACAENGKYLINFSTDFVFSGEKNSFYTEKDTPSPIEWYGQTKLKAEEEIQSLASNFQLQASILRIAFPFRASFPPKLDLVRTVLSKLKEGNLYPLFDDQKITPTFIDDIARAVDVFIQKQPVGIYHVVGSTVLSPYELGLKIADVFGFDRSEVKLGKLEEYLKRDSRPRQKFLGLSNEKLLNNLRVKMLGVREGLAEVKKQL